MKTNLFLRSTLRQPVKAAMLLLVAALITFAFVSRVSEYLLIRQETERLGSYYRSVGTVKAKSGDHWEDTSEVIEYLEESPYVASATKYDYTSAVILDDVYNMTGENRYISFYTAFYGTLYLYDKENGRLFFAVDSVLAGYPEYISEGGTVVAFIRSGYEPLEDMDGAIAKLEMGGRYLVTAGYNSSVSECKVEMALGEKGMVPWTRAYIYAITEDSLFLPVAQDHEASLSDLDECLQRDAILSDLDNQRSLNIVPVQDMRDLPLVQNAENGFTLAAGRWLTSEDDGRKVCVIDAEFAEARGLEVGDTLTLRLRDIPSVFGVFAANTKKTIEELMAGRGKDSTDTYEIIGIYRYLYEYSLGIESSVHNFAYIPYSAIPEDFVLTTAGGLNDFWDYNPNFEGTLMFDYCREAFGDVYSTLPYPNAVSFTLISPDVEDQFIAESQLALSDMGWNISMVRNNWVNFNMASTPMRQSSLLNSAIFSVVLLVAVCLIALIYYRMRRKDIAIARALGVSARKCAGQAALPLLGVTFLGAGAGGWLGWQYTLESGGSILETLGGTADVTLPYSWLAAAMGLVFVLLLAAAEAGAVWLSTRPVLTLLQGGAAAGTVNGSAPEVPREVPQTVPVTPAAFTGTAVRGRGKGPAHVLRFVWRHIVRAKARTALSVLLALGFTVGLAAIQLAIVNSQEKVDWLYEHTPVEAELVQVGASGRVFDSGLILGDTVDALLDSGYVTSVYLEGMTSGGVVQYTETLKDGGGYTNIVKAFRGISDEPVFLSAAGSGGTVSITYFDGWDGSFFSQEWTKDDETPIVIPKDLYDALELEGDGLMGLIRSGSWTCRVAGYYVGEVAGDHTDAAPVLIPLSVYQSMGGRRITYSKVHVTLIPSLNRELEPFIHFLTELTAGQGTGITELYMVIWDEELRTAVAPLENSVVLMRLLYLAILVLSLLVAAGIAVLFVMTSAKEAAIMRALGTSKLRSRIMLALQTVFTSAAGLLAGLLGILTYTERTRPDLFANLLSASALCAMLYLLAAIVGAAASAAAVTRRNPLELLQIKE